METLIVTGAAGSIGTRVCKTLAETDGVAAILAIDTRPEMPNHRRVYHHQLCLLYTSPSPRDATLSRMPSSA